MNRKELGRELSVYLAYYKHTRCPVFFSVSRLHLAALGRAHKAGYRIARQQQTSLFDE